MGKEKDGNYSLNTVKEIWKYDPVRLIDLGNLAQVLISQNKPEVNEEARASSNFEKLTEDRRRPVSHTLVDATRVLPDIIALATGPGVAVAKKAVGKNATKATGSKVAKKLVKERTDDAAKDLTKSLLLARDDKDMAAKTWLRKMWENKEAINRAANKNLSDEEIRAVREALPGAAKPELESINTKVDTFKEFLKNNKELSKLTPEEQFTKIATSKELKKQLTQKEIDTLMSNLKEIGEAGKGASFSHFSADRILKGIPKDKHNAVIDALGLVGAGIKGSLYPLSVVNATAKVSDAIINDAAKTKFKTNTELEMKPDYYTRGSMPTPVSDFFASIFNVDFNDPARFNEKDIDTFFEFLEDAGYIEPGIKNKWTPRQKVSVMREILSDETINEHVKEKWANSKHKKNLNKYYMGE